MVHFSISFAEVNSLYAMIYKRNNSLRVSSGPSIAFQLHQFTQEESKHKKLLSGCHVTPLMAALQDKTLSDGSPLSNFEKVPYLVLLQLIDYREQQ